MRGAFRDRHDTRGGMRWTRQRRAGTKVAGRKPGLRACALYKGCVQGPEAREGCSLRRTTALRGAAGMEMHPTDTDFARRPKSCGPAKSGLLFACLRPRARSTAETTVTAYGRSPGRARSKPEAHCVRNAGCVRCFRGDELVRLFFMRMRLRTHRASGVPRALFPREGDDANQNSGASRREIAKLYQHRLPTISMGCLTCESDVGRDLAAIPESSPRRRGPITPGASGDGANSPTRIEPMLMA